MSPLPVNHGPFPPLPESQHPSNRSTAALQQDVLLAANEQAALELSILRRQLEEAHKHAAAVGPDPWKHRSQGMKCGSCMWFVAKKPSVLSVQVAQPRILGRCRRHAPSMTGYPVVFHEDWCGDHKLDEEKL